ncbi:MAG: MarR family winged helix-turn-helix transcriptional regulator [Pikeienuella sp.]
MQPEKIATCFALFTEIGIIEQLSRTLFQAKLPDGMLVSHFSVLNHLSRVGEGQTPLTIAKAFQVPKTTMTHTLAGLEKNGLIRMAPNPADGRSKCVWITEAGSQFRQKAIMSVAPDMMKMAEALTMDEVADILPTLAKIRAYLDEARN